MSAPALAAANQSPHATSIQHPQIGVVAAYECDHTAVTDVTANFINSGGGLVLDVRGTPGDPDDNGGGAVDGVDGIRIEQLSMDYLGPCDDSFIVALYSSIFTLGTNASCTAAIRTPLANGWQHLVFLPLAFGVPPNTLVNGFTIAKFVDAHNPFDVQIKNVRLNSQPIFPDMTHAGCQF